MNGAEHPTNKFQAQTNSEAVDVPLSELEPVTIARSAPSSIWLAPIWTWVIREGARSILEEVVQEGSASQKQEASRLIESLPG